MKVEKIDHIHIYVRDLDAATQFFTEILGTKFCDALTAEEWKFKSTMDPLGVELIQPIAPESPVARALERRGQGLSAISLKVPNIDEATAELEAKGMRVVSKAQHGRLREVQFHPKDAYGVMIELAEYEEEVHGAIEALRRQ